MKVAIVGSGGREHVLAWKFAKELSWKNVFTIPGNDGIPNSYPMDINDFNKIEQFCSLHKIELIFVGNEQPLSKGITDYFADKNIKVFGPDQLAARLESSKIFAKKFMKKYGVSTAEFETFDNVDDAEQYILDKNGNLVIKFDGLAAGKGVFVCSSVKEANEALQQLQKTYGKNFKFIIEDKIQGDEISIIGFTDGKTVKTLKVSQDHKQLSVGDKGPNTGGMGAYCPVEIDQKILDDIQKNIISPSIYGIRNEKMNYKGIIYFGIMVKNNKSYLLEYNVRFGDPEAQVLLPSLQTSMVELTKACLSQNLEKIDLKFAKEYFTDVVLVSKGYPKKYTTGKLIEGLESIDHKDLLIFHAGTKKINNRYYTNGGRVLNLVGRGKTLEEALKKTYNAVKKINFEGMYYRTDIGKRKNQELKYEK